MNLVASRLNKARSFKQRYSDCLKSPVRLLVVIALAVVLYPSSQGKAQSALTEFDPGWMESGEQWIKLRVGELEKNFMYEVPVQDLIEAGLPAGQVQPEELRLYNKGREVPIEFVQDSLGNVTSGDKIRFYGKRNRGQDEVWAYGYNSNNVGTDYYSLFTDHNYYWLTWTPGDASDQRYEVVEHTPSDPYYEGFRDTVHIEKDNTARYEGVDANAELSIYTEAEGFYWRRLDATGSQLASTTFEPTMRNLLLTSEPVTVRMRVAGLSGGERTARLNAYYDDDGDIDYHEIASRSWQNKGSRILQGNVAPADLIALDELRVRLDVVNENDDLNNTQLVNMDWLKFSYFRGFRLPADTAQFDFWLNTNGQNSVNLTNIDNGDSIRVYNTSSATVYNTVKDTAGNAAAFKPEASEGRQQFVAVRNGIYARVASVEAYEKDENLMAESNKGKFLIITRSVFKEEAMQYAQYRNRENGMSAKVVTAGEIWERFDYGLKRPIAIQRFLYYAYNNWQEPPQYVFILADGKDPYRRQPIADNEIPPFGFPASDSWYAMNFEGPRDWIPKMAVGRLTVRKPSTILAYLNKVQNYESSRAQLQPWMKKVAFLSGGFNNSEQQRLYQYNKQMANLIANSPVAADTTLFKKTTNEPLDGSRRSELRELINNGTFILHFFGHTSPNSWDLLTDDPSNFKNKNKPTVVLSLGCYSGQFASSEDRIISEEFVYAPNAAIAYIGGSGRGAPASLNRYANSFHESIFEDTVKTLGAANTGAINGMLVSQPPTYDVALAQNTLILGDPALQLAYPKEPDYVFDNNPLKVRPDPTNISDTSMEISVRIRNLGMRTDQKVGIRLNHRKPKNQMLVKNSTLEPVGRTSTVEYNIPIDENDAGKHQMNFMIDPNRVFEEASKANNQYSNSHLVYSTAVDIINPKDQSIVNTTNPEIEVSSPTAAQGQQYLFEMDTTSSFGLSNEPLSSSEIFTDRIKVSWKPDLEFEQGQTYWWRSRVERTGEQKWKKAAFFIDTTVSGNWWHQNTQTFSRNEFSPSVEFGQGEFEFQDVRMEIRTSSNTFEHATQVDTDYPASTFINGSEFGRLDISFHMVMIDGNTGNIIKSQHYDVHSGIFTNSGAESYDQFIRDINNMNTGDYAVIRVRSFRLFTKSARLFREDGELQEALRSIGGFKAGGGLNGEQPSQLSNTDGYILFGKKGAEDPSEVSEYIVREGVKEADTVLTFNEARGTMTSPLIGPVEEWNELVYSGDLRNNSSTVEVELYGWDRSLENRTLLEVTGGAVNSGNIDLSSYSADEYPYMQLRADLEDPTQRVTPQLKDWRVQYEELPELALDPNSVEVNSDTVEQGYPYEFQFDVSNIGSKPADTLIIDYVHYYNNEPNQLATDTLYDIEPGGSASSSVSVETLGELGEHKLAISISEEFLDEYQYNNYLERPFYVRNDTTGPRLEVFFDNRFIPPVKQPITDKENPQLPFVSARPTIDIYWKDNNPFLKIQDSTSLKLKMFSANESNAQVYTPSSPELSFVPPEEDADKNQAYARFKPDFSQYKDSVVTLNVVARDRTGNISENKEGYYVSFRVKKQVGVTSFYPYPNPMSNFTRFAFQLHGHSVQSIDSFTLRLYTLSGKPVKEFNILEDQHLLSDGRLQIGWNKLRWDGRDEDGDRLANGVYLYTVNLRADGERIPVNNNEVEKIAIIR